MVAFAIASIALTILVGNTLSGLRATGDAGTVDAALSRAQSHLAAASVILTGDTEHADEGDEGVYHWRLTATPVAGTTVRRADPRNAGSAILNDTHLYRVDIVESWSDRGRTRAVHLQTERLAVSLPRAA